MILSRDDLIKAEKKGLLEINKRNEFSAFSLDIHLGKLYKRNEKKARKINEHNLNQEQFIEEILEEVPLKEEGLVVTPRDFYLWQPEEEIFLAKRLYGEIVTRSSWARLGIAARDSSDNYLRNIIKDIKVKPLCILNTTGTNVLIKPRDAFAQLIVKTGTSYVAAKKEKQLIDSGKFVIKRDNKKLCSSEINYHGHMVLTMDSEIIIYKGRVLIPGKPKEDDFEKINIEKDRPFLRKDAFFLSASREYIEIPQGYVGHASEGVSVMTLQKFRSTNNMEYAPLIFWSHANAPYIGPKNVFKGKITFENCMKINGYIKPGIKQAEFYLERLLSKNQSTKPSRYMKQESVTKSKL